MVSVSFTGSETQFRIGVSGEAQVNPDGTSRQALVAKCRAGDTVYLHREPDNPHDKYAIAVTNSVSQVLGYIPAGDRRLADHIDRGGVARASVFRVTGGPTILQKLLRRRGKYYGLVLTISKGSFNWEVVKPWMEANREIVDLLKSARRMEKEKPEISIDQYQEAISKIISLDALGTQASAWRTARYPIDRLSLVMDRQGNLNEALAEIERWHTYPDPVGVSSAEQKSVSKRRIRLAKKTAT